MLGRAIFAAIDVRGRLTESPFPRLFGKQSECEPACAGVPDCAGSVLRPSSASPPQGTCLFRPELLLVFRQSKPAVTTMQDAAVPGRRKLCSVAKYVQMGLSPRAHKWGMTLASPSRGPGLPASSAARAQFSSDCTPREAGIRLRNLESARVLHYIADSDSSTPARSRQEGRVTSGVSALSVDPHQPAPVAMRAGAEHAVPV